MEGFPHIKIDAAEAVKLFRHRMPDFTKEAIRQELAGKNLACWCPIGSPCHADVLLEIANTTTPLIAPRD